MRRREFITLLGGAAAAWPLTVHAQRTGKLPTIGFLGVASPSTWKPWVAAFVQRLRELGWVEGQTIAIEYRWAEGRSERFDEIIAEFVRLNVNVIVRRNCRSGGQTRHLGYSDCFCGGGGPSRKRFGRFSRPTRWQRHWIVEPIG